MKLLLVLSSLPLLAKAQVCEVCGCPTCPEGFRVGNPAAIYDIPVEYQPIAYGLSQASCEDIESVGLQGLIPSSDCPDVQMREDLRATCECPAIPPPPTSAPIMSATAMPVVIPTAPTPTPVMATTPTPVAMTRTTREPSKPSNGNDDIEIDHPITEFILIHAPTNKELVPIHDKDVIVLEDLDVDSPDFNILVTVDERVRSVYFEQTKRPEGDQPFAFCGDEMGDYFTCDIRVGKKTKVTVIPYTGDYQTGTKLPSQSISFKIISSEEKGDKEKNGRDKGDGERAPAPSLSPAGPSRDNCDMMPLLDKAELLMLVVNDRIAKIGFPSIKLDFVSGDTDNGDCGIQINFGMNLKTKLFKNDIELGGSGILAGIAVNDKQWCVENLRVVEFGVDGPLAEVMLGLIEERVLKRTVSEVISDALEDRIPDFCV